MTIRLIYDESYSRTIPAVIIDARAEIPQVKNKLGVEIKAYTDAQTAEIGPLNIPYKLETLNGNVAGYVSLAVNPESMTCQVAQFVLRPAFQQYNSDIMLQISTFIQNNDWHTDLLL